MAKATKDDLKQTGKRKRAIARVALTNGSGKITVNGKDAADYFGNHQNMFESLAKSFEVAGAINQYDVKVNVRGGGKVGQSEAVKSAIAKALATVSKSNRESLKAAGLLSRDARIKEAKKYGRKKARKKFQFSKR